MRTVKPWIGKTDDSIPPPRVRARVAARYADRCAVCFSQLAPKGMEIDHEIALCNGGKNEEGNLVALCKPCHLHKTRMDRLAKKRMDAVRKRHLGIKRRKPKSKWKRKMDGTVVRRGEE